MDINCTTWTTPKGTCGQASANLNAYTMGILTLALPTQVRRVKLRMTCLGGEWRTYMHVFPRDKSCVGGSFGDITLSNKGVKLKPTKRTNPLARQVHELCVGLDEQLQAMRSMLQTRLDAMTGSQEASA